MKRMGGFSLELTEREIACLQWAAAGLTAAETGRRMFVSVETVKSHLQKIYIKLGVKNKTHAVAVAWRRGLID